MEINNALTIAAMGMKAESARSKVAAQNIANADSLPTALGEDPYRRQIVTFKNVFDRALGATVVKVDKVIQDQSEFQRKFDPSHPAADKDGYVLKPNVNTLVEVMDSREAGRAYEANLAALDMAKSMLLQTINAIRT